MANLSIEIMSLTKELNPIPEKEAAFLASSDFPTITATPFSPGPVLFKSSSIPVQLCQSITRETSKFWNLEEALHKIQVTTFKTRPKRTVYNVISPSLNGNYSYPFRRFVAIIIIFQGRPRPVFFDHILGQCFLATVLALHYILVGVPRNKLANAQDLGSAEGYGKQEKGLEQV